jgi:restriction endonuclease S subunit
MKILKAKENVNIRYVYNVMQKINFDATQHKRYWISQYSKIQIPLPPLEVQEQIVAEIEQYQKVIDGARQVVENWKPSFRIDPSWEMVELGELERQEKIQFLRGQGISKKEIVENGKNKCIHYGEIYTEYQPIIKNVVSKTNYEGKIFSKKGDVLIPSTTTADAMGIAVARSLNEDNVILGGDINIIRTENKHILSDYLALLISTPPLKNELATYAKGVNILHISNKDIKNLKIPLPPLEVQEQIVAVIEAEQRAVNANKELVEKMEKKIEVKIGEVWGDEI